MRILKIQIHVVQNVGKVLIGQKKDFPAPFVAIPVNFPWTKQIKKTKHNRLERSTNETEKKQIRGIGQLMKHKENQ